MKLFMQYLSDHRRALLFCVFACAIFGGTFALYGLPPAAVLYPAALTLLAGTGFLISDFIRQRRRHRELARLCDNLIALSDALPEPVSIEGRDLTALITQLCEERAALRTETDTRFGGMIRDYTLWAHQIKTPIASMRLQLQGEDSALSRSLSSELLRIEQYVEMALTCLRLNARDTDYVFRTCDVDALTRQCLRRFSGEFILRRLKLEYAPFELRALTDEKWLGFVIEQVLSNALKYTPSGSIAVYAEGDTLCISDTGIGIAPEDLPRIFENGFTGLNGRSDRKSSGLGLHLCRRILNELGHTICVESVPDRGTTVRIGLGLQK